MRAAIAVLALLVACQSPMAPTAPANAAQSTFRVQVDSTVETGLLGLGLVVEPGQSFGTAWVAFNDRDSSYLVTAGHVCAKGIAEIPKELGGGFLMVDTTYTLRGQDSAEYPADLYVRSDEPDLCILKTRTVIGPAMFISGTNPYYDEPIAYVGAPAMVYGDGMAPMFRGTYAGGTLVTAPTAGGASGSAVFTSHGVIGVLVMVNRRFSSLTYIVSRQDLLAFLREHRLPV